MRHKQEFTNPALLAGLWVFLSMLEIMEAYSQEEMDSLKATYYCDGKVLFTHTGHIPALEMSLNYNQWFIELGTPGSLRTYVEDIDWVLYAKNKYLPFSDVNNLAKEFRLKGIKRLDSDLRGGFIKKQAKL